MYELLQDTGINGWYNLIAKVNDMHGEIVVAWEKNSTLYMVVKFQKPAVNHGTAKREKKGEG